MDKYCKVIKGIVLKDKAPRTIIDAINDIWIVGGGIFVDNLHVTVDAACLAKNSKTNYTGYSPLKLLTGCNLSYPDVTNDSVSTMNILGPQEAFANKVDTINTARKAVKEIETSQKIKTIMKSKILPHREEKYKPGDRVIFHGSNGVHGRWFPAEVLGISRKIEFLFLNFFCYFG